MLQVFRSEYHFTAWRTWRWITATYQKLLAGTAASNPVLVVCVCELLRLVGALEGNLEVGSGVCFHRYLRGTLRYSLFWFKLSDLNILAEIWAESSKCWAAESPNGKDCVMDELHVLETEYSKQ